MPTRWSPTAWGDLHLRADVQWLYKRAQLDAALLGGGARHRAALARLAALKPQRVAA